MPKRRKMPKVPCPFCGRAHSTVLPCGLDVRDINNEHLVRVVTKGTTPDIRHAASAEYNRRVGTPKRTR